MPERKNQTKQEVFCALFTSIAKLIIVQPFDLIRFRIQSQKTQKSISEIYKQIILKEGIKTFLKASNATAASVFIASFVQFSFYQKFQNILMYEFLGKHLKSLKTLEIHKIIKLEKEHCGTSEHCKIKFNSKDYRDNLIKKISLISGLSGLLSGIILCLFTLPLDNIRIKLQSSQNMTKNVSSYYNYNNNPSSNIIEYKANGFKEQFIKTYRIYGLKGFYIGFPISLLRECTASTLYFTTFEHLKNKKKIQNNLLDIKLSLKFMYGCISGAVNWIVTYPIDTIKTKIISDSINKPKDKEYIGVIDCFKKNYNNKGLRGLYVGFSVVLVRGMLVNGVTLSSFDMCRTYYFK